MLSETDHSRDSAGLTYVYPVISRRARGLSIGINLNPNNACNWRCIYCQVPELKRGSAPELDLSMLDLELRALLHDIQVGDFYDQFDVSEPQRQIRDISISGNGEPTSSRLFASVINCIESVLDQTGLLGTVNIVLITNGSLIQHDHVQQGLTKLNRLNADVWFKLDRASDKGIHEVNQSYVTVERVWKNLNLCASLCKTWIQTSVFKLDGLLPDAMEWQAYLEFLARYQKDSNYPVQGVLLYGLARDSMQSEAERLERLSDTEISHYAESIRGLGFQVQVST